ncbi:alpha/beta fold hydrolase [Promicromonospora vindobonensis]|uniref:Alpha/beta fold hydrolase n=1 Tax=Promicromonospora vindobonensis TaxID=195748 RepID=A0ABW5VPX1_9MICO
MAVVLVHGAPETSAVWEPLVSELASLGRSDVVRLSPPGFGAPLPSDFGATVDDYRNWLIGELSAFEEPVDLVGHDWGGLHVLGVAMNRPDLLRSWVSDAVGVFEPDYEWHAQAQVWQTPDEGERVVDEIFSGDVEERTARVAGWGILQPAAAGVAAGQGEEMGRAMLALYRSTPQPVMAEIGRNLSAAAARPGLAIIAAADDVVGTVDQRRSGAARAGARAEVLEGLNHWWMLEDPALGARVLSAFWESL